MCKIFCWNTKLQKMKKLYLTIYMDDSSLRDKINPCWLGNGKKICVEVRTKRGAYSTPDPLDPGTQSYPFNLFVQSGPLQ